jgi:hypothetical protein
MNIIETHREFVSNNLAKRIRQVPAYSAQTEWIPSALRELLEGHERPFRPSNEQDQWIFDREAELTFDKAWEAAYA